MSVQELAARYAALVALNDAVTGEKTKTSAELAKAVWEQGIKRGNLTTPLGDLTLRENKGGLSVVITDEDALLGWCEEHSPESIEKVTRVRAHDRDAIVGKRFVPVAGKVVDSLSGEVVEFAKVVKTDPSAPTPSYGASERQREVKALAADVTASRLSLLTDVLTARVYALEPPDFDKQEGE